ncbi:metalloprotease PmbA [Legionella londiniensis]|uniref:Peptide maturation protein PmbA n=1 Tax=Legionella londiniensis TaxID=45068 RepID=A0A0W0VPL4_9GAMM|nr:metalloprotease PmbA [Legionella londiniensis]KTD21705.1 peptide maturation protein PmbA [Legionella londiniensis]STX93460.1 peptide maturation protein PmbA [Legionella londiniensis]
MQISTQNSNIVAIKSTDELMSLMKAVLKKTVDFGASDAAVNVNYDSGFAVDVRMGKVETVTFSEDKGVNVTVYFGQKKGSASTTDTSDAAIESMVKAACEIAQCSAEDPCFGLADPKLINNQYPDLDLLHPWPITPQQAIELAIDCEQQAISFDKRISNSDGVSISTYIFSHGYANTYGCEGVVSGSRHGVSCSLVAKEGEIMQRDYDYTTARSANDLLPLDVLARRAAERAVSRLGAKKIKTQKVPVVFSSRVSAGLFASFVSAISGSNLYRKNSFLVDAIGKRIFPQIIQVYEQPHLSRGLGSAPFDGEGVPTRNNIFIKDGILTQYVLNSYSARKLGLKTTANCGGVFNLTIDPTAGDLEDILQKMGRGLLVTELMGQGVNILTGDYSRGASGFWVEDGQIQHPVEEITIASNLQEMFNSIQAVGKDINPNVTTRCGSVLIAEMMVGGN